MRPQRFSWRVTEWRESTSDGEGGGGGGNSLAREMDPVKIVWAMMGVKVPKCYLQHRQRLQCHVSFPWCPTIHHSANSCTRSLVKGQAKIDGNLKRPHIT